MLVRYYPGAGVFVTACMTAALCAPVPCGAAEWSAEPSVRLRREYNDNIRMSIHPHKSVNGSIVTPSLDAGVSTSVWKISGGAEATQRRYSGEGDLDRNDSTLKLSSQYISERSTWQLDASRTRDSVLSDELISSDTGVVPVQKQRESSSVNPAWTWMFSERTQMQLTYQLSNVSYEDAQRVGLYDYGYRTATVTVANQLSELNQVFVSGGYSAFHVLATGFDSNTRSLQAGITRNFSETTQGTLQAGLRRTESITKGGAPIYTYEISPGVIYIQQTGVTQDVRSQTTSPAFSGNLETKSESTRLKMSLSRSLDPSGSGGQVEQDTFKFDLNRQLTARASVNAIVNVTKVRASEGNISSNERTYYDLGPGAYWQWTREWTVGANFRYAHVKRVYEDRAAVSRTAYLALEYRPLKISISR